MPELASSAIVIHRWQPVGMGFELNADGYPALGHVPLCLFDRVFTIVEDTRSQGRAGSALRDRFEHVLR